MSSPLSRPDRIAVVDDHAIVRYGYAQLIGQQPDLCVCDTVASEREALEMVERERPDLVIVDLSLNDGDGMELIKALVKRQAAIKILVISAHDESLFAPRVLAAGAMGYINKQGATEKLIDGIRSILNGEVFFSHPATQNLLRGRLHNAGLAEVDEMSRLTDRELQVFGEIGTGHSTRQIAEKLGLSVKTIERYKENIKLKLRLANATQLVQHATQWVIDQGK